MGCISSKILTKSASFRDEFNRKFQAKPNSLENIVISKNRGEQFVALVDSVAKRIKEVPSPAREPQDSCSVAGEEPENNEVETIDASEMLAGLLEDEGPITPSKRFRTLEEYDALVAASSKESEFVNGRGDREECSEKGSKRKTMKRELSALKVPAFEFTRDGSLRDWLLKGGQVFSPGSYITPKFGNSISQGENNENGDDANVIFDPELVAQFEQAMEELTMEEESILKEIIENLEGSNEE